MRNSEEFKSEVYRRADIEKKRIKRRRKAVLTAVPCIAAVLVSVVLASRFVLPDTEGSVEKFNDGRSEGYNECAESASKPDEYDAVYETVNDASVDSTQPDDFSAGSKPNGGATSLVKSFRRFKHGSTQDKKSYPSVTLIRSEQELYGYLDGSSDLSDAFKAYLKTEVSAQSDYFSTSSIIIAVTDGEYAVNSARFSGGTLTLEISKSATEAGDEYYMAVAVPSSVANKPITEAELNIK